MATTTRDTDRGANRTAAAPARARRATPPLRQDFDAVTAGLALEWSSGKVEGKVDRAERIKGDGQCRAGFALLRCQMLLADRASSPPATGSTTGGSESLLLSLDSP